MDGRDELISRILASRYFAHADLPRRILQYLCRRAADTKDGAAKEYEIATEAMRRPASFDPKTDPIVRVTVASVRGRLRSYFTNEGRAERLRLSIPKNQYRAEFRNADPMEEGDRQSLGDPYLRSFWTPYIAAARPNVLVYTELLFLRDDKGNFHRNIFLNEPAGSPEEIKTILPEVAGIELRPSFHFVSGGEMMAVLAILRAFHALGAGVDVRNSRFSSWVDLQTSNLILLGSARTNPFLRSLQGDDLLKMLADSIQNGAPQNDELRSYGGKRVIEGGLERVTEYALVSRRPGPGRDNFVTLISANHGRAMEGAVQYLTQGEDIRLLLERFNRVSFPDHFQILLRVEMLDFDEEIMNVEYVTHRAL